MAPPLPAGLRAALDSFAAQRGLRSVSQVLTCAARQHIKIVSSTPAPVPRASRTLPDPATLYWTKERD